MNPKPLTKKTRVYRSPLRKERAEQTRERILEGVVQVMARNGIAELSIPMIAREAGVSVPSVYHHFPTKRELIAALDDYAQRKGGFSLSEFPPLNNPDDLANIILPLFKRREAIEPTIAAAFRSRVGYDLRRPQLEERARYFGGGLQPITEQLSRKEGEWLEDVVFVLTSYGCVRAFRDYLGLDTTQAAERVAWAIRTLARGAVPSNEEKDS
jgi:AcrR family transcriptional regulator